MLKELCFAPILLGVKTLMGLAFPKEFTALFKLVRAMQIQINRSEWNYAHIQKAGFTLQFK